MKTGLLLLSAAIAGTIGMLSFSSSASADTMTVQGDVITVQARVAPMTYVMVDASGKITQIDSNNNLDGDPTVYLNKVQVGNERPLTPEIYKQFRTIVPIGQNRIGTLYKAPVITQKSTSTSTVSSQSIMRLLSINSSLRLQ